MVSSSSEVPSRRRAVSDELKDQRRAAILDAALHLLEREAYAEVTMATVARASGIAKGTVYLYFPSKESMFLALLGERYGEWFDAAAAVLGASADPQGIPSALVETLLERPHFLRLMALLHVVLERNVAEAELLDFKRMLAKRTGALGAQLEARLHLAAGVGLRLLTWLQAAVPDLVRMARPPEAVRAAMQADPALAVFATDARAELIALLQTLIRGLAASPRSPHEDARP